MSLATSNKPSLASTLSSSSSYGSRESDTAKRRISTPSSFRSDEKSKSFLSSVWGVLDRVDCSISRQLFELTLPTSVEALFTVPACFFGLIPTVFLGPVVLAILALSHVADDDAFLEKDDDYALMILRTIAVLLATSFLVLWCLFLQGKRWPLSQCLGKKILYPVGFPWSIGILYFSLKPNSHNTIDIRQQMRYDKVFSLAIYSLYIWSWTVLTVLILKRWSKRLRPCAKYNRKWILDNKSFPVIPIMLSKTQADESFPSGDAASAAALAIPMLYIDSTEFATHWNLTVTTVLAGGIVLLACAGRIYFLAHHFADVLAGVVTAAMVHGVSTHIGFGVFDMQWWHPFVANAFVILYAKLSERKSD